MRILLLAAAMLPLAACHASWDNGKDGERGHHGSANAIAPSGTGGSRSFAAKDFTSIEQIGPDTVEVKQGATFSVLAQGDAKALDDLEISVAGGELRIGRKDHGWGMSNDTGSARITVTMPRLTAVSLTGSGDLTASNGEGDFDLELTGSGNFTLGALNGGNVDLKLTGSGDVKVASGTVTRLLADVTGSGDIDTKGVTASGAKVSVMGSGNVYGTVKGDADVSIMGSGDVELTGGAKCKTSAMGPGEARCS